MAKLLSFEGFELIVTFLASIVMSSGFWLYMTKRSDAKDLNRRLLIGLAHDRIVDLSLKYIERGCITKDEYENLHDFLFQPYKEIGGNGSAKRLMDEVERLPIINQEVIEHKRSIRNEAERQDVRCP